MALLFEPDNFFFLIRVHPRLSAVKALPQISQRGRAATKAEKTLTADGRGSTRMKKMNQVQGGGNQGLKVLRSSALIRETAGKPGRARITAKERGWGESASCF